MLTEKDFRNIYGRLYNTTMKPYEKIIKNWDGNIIINLTDNKQLSFSNKNKSFTVNYPEEAAVSYIVTKDGHVHKSVMGMYDPNKSSYFTEDEEELTNAYRLFTAVLMRLI